METILQMAVRAKDIDHSISEIKFKESDNLMRLLVSGGMHLEASCDGECACSTCHIKVDEGYLDKLDPISEDEDMMLDYTDHRMPNSRLACQIKLTEKLSGMPVEVIGH